MKKLLYVLSLLVIASMVLTACGGAPAATEPAATEPAATEPAAEPPGEVAVGGESEHLGDLGERAVLGAYQSLGEVAAGGVDECGERLPLARAPAVHGPAVHAQAARDVLDRAPAGR